MSLTLYSGPLSLFTAKVRIALDEKGLDYERIEVGWSLRDRYEPHHPDVVRLNPRKQVPVLVDGDVVVWDSTQILEYLEDRFPAPALYPRDVALRARCRRLEAVADELVFPHVWARIEEVFYPAPPGGRDPERAAMAERALRAHWAALDAELGEREWLCDAFGVADIALGVFAFAASTLGVPIDERTPRLRAWSERLAAREAVAREQRATSEYVASLFAGGGAASATDGAAVPARA
ncbi:MAG: glutathione S-transferase family protein [Myxococcales bacterium]|nr:glutathione S-transferase family protein [Myxococcales bacterium]